MQEVQDAAFHYAGRNTYSDRYPLFAGPAGGIELGQIQRSANKCPILPVSKTISALPASERTEAINNLTKALKSREVEVRRRAALTLGDLGDKSGVAVMIKDLTIPDLRNRQNVAVALFILNDRRAIPAWRQALKDKAPYIRTTALRALGRLKAQAAFMDIVSLIHDNESEGNCTALPVACTACDVLVTLGNRRAVPFLIRALNDEHASPFTAQAVAHALGELTQQPLGFDKGKWNTWWEESGRARYQ